MDQAALQEHLDNIFDQALVYHGFTQYLRDYELIAHCTADPRTGIAPSFDRFLFKLCVYANVETAVTEEIWSRSLDDRLIDYRAGVDLEGYVWGVNWQLIYPGGQVIPDSERAQHWADALGRPFHEVRIATNGYNITLVFSDLAVESVDPGHSPFTVGEGGPDAKTAFE